MLFLIAGVLLLVGLGVTATVAGPTPENCSGKLTSSASAPNLERQLQAPPAPVAEEAVDGAQ
jgi:hypothetical protein